MKNRILVVLLFMAFSFSMRADLSTGLVAYYPFSGNANDASGNGNSGIVNGATLTADRFGNSASAYSFNGSSSDIEVANIFPMQNEQTITVWVNPATLNGYLPIVEKAIPGFGGEVDFQLRIPNNGIDGVNGTVNWVANTDNGATGIFAGGSGHTILPVGQWSFVACSIDQANNQVCIYVNGILDATYSMGGRNVRNMNRPFRIGKQIGQQVNYSFNGNVDDVRIYNRALSESEIESLYSLPAPTQLTITQTNRAPTTNEIGQPTIPTDTNHFKVFANGAFQSGITLDPTKMTVVMTHGFMSSPDSWATQMANYISANVSVPTPNIVAWDWSSEAGNNLIDLPIVSTRTLGEGYALATNLLAALGTSYSQPVHFIGHSLGTLVNSAAANYLHGNAPNNTQQYFNPANTQMTLFDEAELAPEILNALTSPSFYYKPIPMQAAWIDNYISAFGFAYPEAANVILTDDFPSNAPDLSSLIAALTAFHSYPCQWYDESILNPTGSLMGYRWSFEQNNLIPTPATNAMFIQSAVDSELDLQQISFDYGAGLLNARFVLYAAEPGIAQAVTRISTIVQAAGQVDGAIDDAGNTVVNLFTSIGSVSLVQESGSAHPLGGPTPSGGSANNNSPAFAWVPLNVPSNAISMSFDFTLQGNGNNDSLQAALNGTNVLSLETTLIQTNTTLNSGLIDVSQYAGTNIELFLGIVGGTSTNAQLTVSAIQFYSAALPSLRAQASGDSLVLSWPLSPENFNLQITTNLADPTSWITLKNIPAIVNLQNTVTNPICGSAAFYRLIQ